MKQPTHTVNFQALCVCDFAWRQHAILIAHKILLSLLFCRSCEQDIREILHSVIVWNIISKS